MTMQDVRKSEIAEKAWIGGADSGGGLVRQFAEAASIVFSLKQLTITYPV